MKDEKFDELFDEAFKRAANSASPVDPESRRAAWQRVQKQRQQHSVRRRRSRNVRLTGAAAGLILFGSVAFSEPVRTGALTPLYQKLYSWNTGEVVVVLGENKPIDTEGALTAPPPPGIEKPIFNTETIDEDEVTNIVRSEAQIVNLEEVRQRLAYPMPEFPRIPADQKLYEANLVVANDGSAPIGFLLRYKGTGERELSIQVDQLEENSNRTYGFGTGTIREVKLDNGLTGQFVKREDDALLHFVRGNLDFFLTGTLTSEELIEIAGHVVDGTR